MNSLKYLVNGTVAAMVCVFAATLATSTLWQIGVEPGFWLGALLPVALCFLVPPLVTSALFGRGGAANDAFLGAIISIVLYWTHYRWPWFFFLAFCSLSLLGGWLGGKLKHVAP